MRAWSRPGFDAGLAALMAGVALVEAFTGPERYPLAFVVVSAVAFAAPLAVRRTRPLVALGLVLGVLVVQRLVLGEIWDTGSSLAIPMIAIYSAAAYTSLRVAIGAFVVATGVMSVCDINDGGDSPDVAFLTLIFGAMWIAGRMTHRQRELAEANAAYARELEAVQEVREQSVALEERARIARELHDVVAHCVSTIVVQAEAGQALLATEPRRAEESFGAIQDSGRQALAELRRMLGLLRDPDATVSSPPQPGLARLESLVDGIRHGGLDVTVDVVGEPRPLPPGLDLSAFRIVQESLTNTLKHAEATHATVRLAYDDTGLDIEVSDDGRGPGSGSPGTGHGLLGMRERARLHGALLESEVGPHGGYVVRTRLPLP
jgi:signal transduction histidine kinase